MHDGSDCQVVSSSRDGQVRLTEVSDGLARTTRRLAQHTGPCRQVALHPKWPHVVLSIGEDGFVRESDVRAGKCGQTVASLTDSYGSSCGILSIHANPVRENIYCVGGRSRNISIMDRRMTSLATPPLHTVSPFKKKQNPHCAATGAVFTAQGDAIVATFNDSDVFQLPCESNIHQPILRFSGHRNQATMKGVSLFGRNSEYVMSGSDCGSLFIWDRKTQAIVRCIEEADINGVVNVIEAHPFLPVLASSGLDSDVKIWFPIGQNVDLDDIETIVKRNMEDRQSYENFYDEPRFMGALLHQLGRLPPRDPWEDDHPPMQCVTQ